MPSDSFFFFCQSYLSISIPLPQPKSLKLLKVEFTGAMQLYKRSSKYLGFWSSDLKFLSSSVVISTQVTETQEFKISLAPNTNFQSYNCFKDNHNRQILFWPFKACLLCMSCSVKLCPTSACTDKMSPCTMKPQASADFCSSMSQGLLSRLLSHKD